MSMKDQFTKEEWMKVVTAPGMAGALVFAASPSGPIGMMQEMQATSAGAREFLQQYASSSPLLQSMLDEASRQLTDDEKKALLAEAQEKAKAQMEAMKGDSPEQQTSKILGQLQEAIALVKAKGSAADVENYKQLLMSVAQRTAEAAKEGGFLGIGGVAVSDQEKAMLDKIRQAIG